MKWVTIKTAFYFFKTPLPHFARRKCAGRGKRVKPLKGEIEGKVALRNERIVYQKKGCHFPRRPILAFGGGQEKAQLKRHQRNTKWAHVFISA